MRANWVGCFGVFVLLVNLAQAPASAAVLFGHNGFGGAGQLYSIDTVTLATALIGTGTQPPLPEIELNPTGTVIFGGIKSNSGLFSIDPATGMNGAAMAVTFPVGFDSVTAMEFVGSTLYGAMTVAGASVDSVIATIDTTTGVITTVGDTLLDPPLGGLAYDLASSTMYGVTTTSSFISELVTIDLATGIGTSVGTIMLDGVPQRAITGLEFASDGNLFAVQTQGLPGHLFQIDKASGVMTDLGGMGIVVTSLTEGLAPSIACDFDGSGTCDVIDLNLMLNEGPIAGGVPVNAGNEQYDLDSNGVIDNMDRDIWLADAGSFNGFSSPFKLGDANLDGFVDGLDFIRWNENKFSSTLNWDDGNFNSDGFTDGLDFIQWNDNKFTMSDGYAVPEPAMMTLVGLALLLCLSSRRRGM
jgi:hypothetical protein